MAEQYATTDKMLVAQSAYDFEEEAKKLRGDGYFPMWQHTVSTNTNEDGTKEVVFTQHWTKTVIVKK